MSFNLAPIYVNLSVVHWRNPHPSKVISDKDHKHFTEDKHFSEYKDLAEQEDLRLKPLFFHQSSISSTYDSAESIATLPPDSDLDDDQIRALLTSSLYLQEREAYAERSQVYHPVKQVNVQFISGSD